MHFSHSHGVKLCGSSWNHLQTPLAAAWFSPFFSWNLGKLSSSLSPFARGDFKGVQESIGGNFATGSCPLWRNITEVPLDFFTTCRLCCRPSWPHPHKKKWTQTNPTKYTQNLKSVSFREKQVKKQADSCSFLPVGPTLAILPTSLQMPAFKKSVCDRSVHMQCIQKEPR